MKIWLINHYAGNTFFDKGGRHYYIAKYLKKNGHDVTVFCSNAKHITRGLFFENGQEKLFVRKKQKDINVPYVFIKSRTYEKNNSERIMNMYDFYQNIKRTAALFGKHGEKPDIIIASSVHPLTLLAGQQIAKKFKIKCICEVRDLWPESFLAYDVAKSKNSPVMKILYRFEKHLYVKADKLIFTIEGAYDYIKDKGWTNMIPESKVFCINNGVDLKDFNFNKDKYQIDDNDLVDASCFKVVYTGSIRHVNNVGKILDIAEEFKNEKIKFLIYGAGDEVDFLKERIKTDHINNVFFKGFIDKKYVPYIISQADLNMMDMQESSDIFKYGISPNKLFEYFAAKKPVLMYQLDYYNPALTYGVGYSAETMQEIIDIIIGIMNHDEKYQIADRNFEKACQAYSYEGLTDRIIEVIKGCG